MGLRAHLAGGGTVGVLHTANARQAQRQGPAEFPGTKKLGVITCSIFLKCS